MRPYSNSGLAFVVNISLHTKHRCFVNILWYQHMVMLSGRIAKGAVYKSRHKIFNFWFLVLLILEVWRYSFDMLNISLVIYWHLLIKLRRGHYGLHFADGTCKYILFYYSSRLNAMNVNTQESTCKISVISGSGVAPKRYNLFPEPVTEPHPWVPCRIYTSLIQSAYKLSLKSKQRKYELTSHINL